MVLYFPTQKVLRFVTSLDFIGVSEALRAIRVTK